MTDLLNSSSKHPPRSCDRGLKKVHKVTSTPTIKNRLRSPHPPSSDSSSNSSHRSSYLRSPGFSYYFSWSFCVCPVNASLNYPQLLQKVPSHVLDESWNLQTGFRIKFIEMKEMLVIGKKVQVFSVHEQIF